MTIGSDWRFYTNGELYVAVRVVEKDGQDQFEVCKYTPDSEIQHTIKPMQIVTIPETCTYGLYEINRKLIPAELEKVIS